MLRIVLSTATIALLAGCVGGAEDTSVFVQDRSANSVTVGIHISLLNHPPETHVLGYNNMQALADSSCQEFGRQAAVYTGNQQQVSAGNAYDTWIERTYNCT